MAEKRSADFADYADLKRTIRALFANLRNRRNLRIDSSWLQLAARPHLSPREVQSEEWLKNDPQISPITQI